MNSNSIYNSKSNDIYFDSTSALKWIDLSNTELETLLKEAGFDLDLYSLLDLGSADELEYELKSFAQIDDPRLDPLNLFGEAYGLKDSFYEDHQADSQVVTKR